MITEIFNSYTEFLARSDKSVNGVSQKFAEINPDFEADNETNEGCWNCTDCSDCEGCKGCIDCTYCEDCTGCEGLVAATGVTK